MNQNLIDHELLDLLRIPKEQRAQSAIASAIQQIANAALLDVTPALEHYREHAKLQAIVEWFACESGAERYDVQLDSASNANSKRHDLCALIVYDSTKSSIGWGTTAEEVMKDLHDLKTGAKPHEGR